MSHEIQQNTGLKARQLGLRLGVPRTTWQRWQSRSKNGDSLLHKPGPKKLGPLPLAQVAVEIATMRHRIKRTHGTGALYTKYREGMSRRELAVKVEEERGKQRQEKRGRQQRLRWKQPNLVWAIDATEYARDGQGQKLWVHAVKDLASRYQLEPLTALPEGSSLGTYMRKKAQMPQLKQQLEMALRFHATKGDMKWVSLLLWAGADPRAEVPSLEGDVLGEELGTALNDAIAYGKVEVVRKFKIDPRRDDIGALLERSGLSSQPEIVDLLLAAGGGPKENSEVIKRYVRSLGWTLEGDWFRRDPKPIVDCLCLLAAKGMKWNPLEKHDYRYLRKGLSRAQPSVAIDVLTRLVRAGLFTEEVFKELVCTPRMREVLGSGHYAASPLREFAGFEEPRPRRRRRQRVAQIEA